MRTRFLAIVLAGFIVAASGCAQGNATPAPATQTRTPAAPSGGGSSAAAPGSGAGSGSSAPAVPTIDAIGTLDQAASACHLFHADNGQDYQLTGVLTAEIEAKLGASGHPVHITGTPAAASCGPAPGVDVLTYSFTDGIYATKAVATGVTWRNHQFPSLFGAFET